MWGEVGVAADSLRTTLRGSEVAGYTMRWRLVGHGLGFGCLGVWGQIGGGLR